MASALPGDTPELPNISSTHTVYHGAVWDVVRETFDYRGEVLDRDFVDHPGAAAVVALDEQRRVLLLRQYRHPVRSRNWEIPAGLLDMPGEDPEECARRELAEEASYSAETLTHLGTFNVSPGGSNEVIHIYLAEGLRPIAHEFERTGEEADLEVEFWPLDAAVQAVIEGRIANQIAAIALLLAHVRLQRAS